MKSYDPKKPLISIHIPKCAGTSFSNILRTWFGENLYQHYQNESENQKPIKHSLYTGLFKNKPRPGICIHGHFNNLRGDGVSAYYPKADQFITILRDPFDLLISTYFYVKISARTDQAYFAGKLHPIIANGWKLEDYLRERKKSYICNFLPPHLSLDNYKQVIDEQFIFVGASEYLQESVNILANKLGFPALEVPVSNVSEWDENIPSGARDEFIKNNPLEMAIYDFVKSRFE